MQREKWDAKAKSYCHWNLNDCVIQMISTLPFNRKLCHCLWHHSSFYSYSCCDLLWFWLELAWFVGLYKWNHYYRIVRGSLEWRHHFFSTPLMGNDDIRKCHTLQKANLTIVKLCVWIVFSNKKKTKPFSDLLFERCIFWGLNFHFAGTFHLSDSKWVFKFKNWNGNVNEFSSFWQYFDNKTWEFTFGSFFFPALSKEVRFFVITIPNCFMRCVQCALSFYWVSYKMNNLFQSLGFCIFPEEIRHWIFFFFGCHVWKMPVH